MKNRAYKVNNQAKVVRVVGSFSLLPYGVEVRKIETTEGRFLEIVRRKYSAKYPDSTSGKILQRVRFATRSNLDTVKKYAGTMSQRLGRKYAAAPVAAPAAPKGPNPFIAALGRTDKLVALRATMLGRVRVRVLPNLRADMKAEHGAREALVAALMATRSPKKISALLAEAGV